MRMFVINKYIMKRIKIIFTTVDVPLEYEIKDYWYDNEKYLILSREVDGLDLLDFLPHSSIDGFSIIEDKK